MNNLEYRQFDGLGLASLIRDREVTADELLDAALEQVRLCEPEVRAISLPLFERAREAIREGLPAGPFSGIPYMLKDSVSELAGAPLSGHSPLLHGITSAADQTLIRRCKQAGLVIFGKTAAPELSLSFTTEPEVGPAATNPWDITRSPGGSSGGAAAAVAAGYLPIAHATDGAGSLRVPAAHCGLFGFKPSRMLNPLGPANAEGLAGMATAHCISRSVRDSAMLLDLTHGADVGDPYYQPPTRRRFFNAIRRDPAPLRIAYSTHSPLGLPIDPACESGTVAAARLCEQLGHHVEESTPAYDIEQLQWAWRVIGGVGALAAVHLAAQIRGLATPLDLLEPVNRQWMEEAQRHSGLIYLRAVQQLHKISRQLGAFFQRYDVLLTPVTAQPAPLLGKLSGINDLDDFYTAFWRHAPFTAVFNASGCPAMSLPLGQTLEGLPLGVQAAAALGQDEMLFALAGQLERARPWFSRVPAWTTHSPLKKI